MRTPAPISYLRLIIGVFFVVIGVFAVIGIQQSTVIVGQDIAGIAIAFGIVEVLGGLSLIVGVFTSFRIGYIQVMNYILLYVWIAKIILNILSLIFPTFPSTSGVALDVTQWIVSFTLQAVLLSSLFIISRDYAML